MKLHREPDATFYCWCSIADLPPSIADGMSFFRRALDLAAGGDGGERDVASYRVAPSQATRAKLKEVIANINAARL